VTPDAAEGVESDFPLARLTTVRTGGPADHYARPTSRSELMRLLEWATDRGLQVGVVGSGSNLLVSDEGFRGLVIKLAGRLAAIERDGERMLCGGGARLPSVAARAASYGLSGIEFGINIPGTVGGAVKMNANAYGGELAAVLETVDVVSAGGEQTRRPSDFDFAYRSSNLGPTEIVTRASFNLSPKPSEEIKATLAEMRGWRRDAQPAGIKTFGSTFKNPDPGSSGGRTAGQLLADAGCAGLEVGGVRFSAKHANFVENRGDGTTSDVIALMTRGRAAVAERFGVTLEPEVQLLGDVSWPSEWGLDD
jgi:UDP-N-acetylmuramate dehydrogenase